MRDKVYRLVFPMLSAWAVFSYIHLVQALYAWKWTTGLLWLPFFFVPVAAAEFWITRRFHNQYGKARDQGPAWRFWAAYSGNLCVWLMAFGLWAGYVAYHLMTSPAYQWYGPGFFVLVSILWRSMSWIAVLGVCVWLGVHYAVTLRWGRFRIITSVAFYFFLTLFFYLFQWHYGDVGGLTATEITSQPGVEKVFDLSELTAALEKDTQVRYRVMRPPEERFLTKERIKALNKSRGIRVESGAMYLVFGGTYIRQLSYPAIVKKDRSTGELTYQLTDSNVRRVEMSGGSLFIAPWHDPNIYELSASDLSMRQAIAYQVRVPPGLWEPMCLVKDVVKDRLYVSTNFYPSLLSYDLKTGRLLKTLDLADLGITNEAGIAWGLVQSEKTRMLYAVVAPGKADVIEVDPDTLQITRTLDLSDEAGTELVLDDEAQKLFYQSGVRNRIVKIDIGRFIPEREYPGEFHSHKSILDKKRNVLYVLGYTSGYVFSVDLESGERLWKVRVGGRPRGMALFENSLWVHSMAGAFRLDLPSIWREKGYTGSRFYPKVPGM